MLTSVIDAVRRQLSKYPQTEEDDAALIKDKGMFRLLSYNQRMAVRHRRNEKRLLKRTIAALEKQIVVQGLESEDLSRAEGSTLGRVLPADARRYGMKQKTALEDRLEKMGLPADATEEQIRAGLNGNICRCGTYANVLEAVISLVKGN